MNLETYKIGSHTLDSSTLATGDKVVLRDVSNTNEASDTGFADATIADVVQTGLAGGGLTSLKIGATAADQATVKGIYLSAVVAVAVPTIADAESDEVDVDISASLTVQPAVGDAVIAIPQEALPTDCLFNGARVSATDHVILTFGTKEGGGGVTGANKNFKFLIIDLT